MAPIYCCALAFKPDHRCVYVVCSPCYSKIRKPRLDQGRRSSRRGRDVDKDKNQCDHKNLDVFADTKYFEQSYLNTCSANEDSLPQKCANCNNFIKKMAGA